MLIMYPQNGLVHLQVHPSGSNGAVLPAAFQFSDPMTPKTQLDQFLTRCPGFAYSTLFLIKVQDIKTFLRAARKCRKKIVQFRVGDGSQAYLAAGAARLDASWLDDEPKERTLCVRTELKFLQAFTKHLSKDSFFKRVFGARRSACVVGHTWS